MYTGNFKELTDIQVTLFKYKFRKLQSYCKWTLLVNYKYINLTYVCHDTKHLNTACFY